MELIEGVEAVQYVSFLPLKFGVWTENNMAEGYQF